MIPYPQIDPVALQIGPLAIRWYGLMYVLGFLAAWFLGRWRATRSHAASPQGAWTPAEVDDLITYCIVGLLVGARVGYVLFYDVAAFSADPLEILQIWHGGMSFHGGAIGVALAFILFARVKSKPLFGVTDFTVVLAPPGLFFGRLGNFINGELWGRPTDVPWAMVFPGPAAGGVPRHPSQLYEAALEGVVLFALLWWFASRMPPRGSVTGLFLLGYGVFRFLVEFTRQPDAHLGFIAWDWLTMGQLLSVPMIALGAALIVLAYARRP
jgi:phosphatidylglycerol:prolipoprotein diacylglycerol transferase